jgi:hypothetical protein
LDSALISRPAFIPDVIAPASIQGLYGPNSYAIELRLSHFRKLIHIKGWPG